MAAAEMIAKEALEQRSEGGSREDVAQTIPMELETVQARSLSLCIDPRVTRFSSSMFLAGSCPQRPCYCED